MENENVTLSDITIQWHPAFGAALRIELIVEEFQITGSEAENFVKAYYK